LVTEIQHWLEALDLGKYREVFAENEIDLAAANLRRGPMASRG
jgi:hypothetical protein